MSQPGIQHAMPSLDHEKDGIKKNVFLPEIPFPQPPAEFGDSQTSPSFGWQRSSESSSSSSDRFLRNCSFSASNISVQLGNSGDLFVNPNISSAVSNLSCTSVQNGQQSVAWRRPSVESESRKDFTQSISVSTSGATATEPVSSVLPYLACIVPPPPPMEKFTELDRLMSSRSVISSTVGILPPPPPMHNIHPSGPPPPPPSFPTALFPDVVQSAGFGDFPSPTKLPPPPTFPKQPKKSSQSLDSSVVAAESPQSSSTLPFKVNLKPVTPSKNPAHPPAIESGGSAVNAAPFHSDPKRSIIPTAVNSVAGSAGRSNAFQDEIQYNEVSVSRLRQRQDLGNTMNFVIPPPPPPPPPLSVDQNIFGRCLKTQQPSLPVAAPVVPAKSWAASQPPPPPAPVAEFKSDGFESSPTVSSLASALRSVRLQSTACAKNGW